MCAAPEMVCNKRSWQPNDRRQRLRYSSLIAQAACGLIPSYRRMRASQAAGPRPSDGLNVSGTGRNCTKVIKKSTVRDYSVTMLVMREARPNSFRSDGALQVIGFFFFCGSRPSAGVLGRVGSLRPSGVTCHAGALSFMAFTSRRGRAEEQTPIVMTNRCRWRALCGFWVSGQCGGHGAPVCVEPQTC